MLLLNWTLTGRTAAIKLDIYQWSRFYWIIPGHLPFLLEAVHNLVSIIIYKLLIYFVATIKGNDYQWSKGRVWFNPRQAADALPQLNGASFGSIGCLLL